MPQKRSTWVCLAVLVVLSSGARPAQKLDPVQETSFSVEFPPGHPVHLNEAAKKALASDRAIADVMKDDGLSVESIPENWFAATEVILGSKAQTGLVVMGTGISVGPYSTGFWVLRRTTRGYELVLSVDAHDLTLLSTRTNGLRDIESGVTASGNTYSQIFKFDGHRYRKRNGDN